MLNCIKRLFAPIKSRSEREELWYDLCTYLKQDTLNSKIFNNIRDLLIIGGQYHLHGIKNGDDYISQAIKYKEFERLKLKSDEIYNYIKKQYISNY